MLEMLEQAARGEETGLGGLLEQYRPRLERMISIRIDPRLRGRIEPRDVLQEAYIEVVQRLPEYVANPSMDFFLWVRFLAGQKLLQLHRKHLDAARRDVRREVPLASRVPEASSIAIASAILDSGATPSGVAIEVERREALQGALESMKAVDRETLVLRHFEQLSNAEIAQLTGISESAASQRYFRALARLREILDELRLRSDLIH